MNFGFSFQRSFRNWTSCRKTWCGIFKCSWSTRLYACTLGGFRWQCCSNAIFGWKRCSYRSLMPRHAGKYNETTMKSIILDFNNNCLKSLTHLVYAKMLVVVFRQFLPFKLKSLIKLKFWIDCILLLVKSFDDVK